jgi:hypothetical protein
MRTLLIALALAAASAASAQTAERDPYFSLIEARFEIQQDGIRIPETADRGDAVLSIPVRHRRTGVLREPITLRGGMRDGATYIEAGAHGYHAGDFGREHSQPSAIWCFSADAESASARWSA